MPNPPERFGFGKNWDKFIRKYFSEERVDISRKHMLEVLGKGDLRGLYFLDVGCGSGLHSLAALRAGAERIVGFDYDQNSVDTSLRVRSHVGNPPNWTVRQGSILDAQFIAELEPADIVYAWGVLLSPAVGAVLMSASTVIVAINARLLRLKVEPKPEANAEPQPEAKK